VVSDSSDEDTEGGGRAPMDGGRLHAGDAATNAPRQATNTAFLDWACPGCTLIKDATRTTAPFVHTSVSGHRYAIHLLE